MRHANRAHLPAVHARGRRPPLVAVPQLRAAARRGAGCAARTATGRAPMAVEQVRAALLLFRRFRSRSWQTPLRNCHSQRGASSRP
eukprot:9995020-Alexandrium_andersonii.AAC.1